MKRNFDFNKLILVLAIVVSLLAVFYFSSTSSTLLYRDAKSHLNIARRVFFSQTPGLAQLGGIWLPFPHVLMLPTIWIDQLYYTGYAGIIPSMISFIILTVTVYKIVHYLTEDEMAAVFASLVILVNPALLYLQSTPMSEMPLLAVSTLSIYFLIKWIKEHKYGDIMGAALCCMLATLCRYDGWFLFACEFATIFFFVVFGGKNHKKAEGHLFLFTFLGGFGIALWLGYNQLIFGNFLNFALGKGSAAWDTQRVTTGNNPSLKYNLVYSAATFTWMAIDNIGLIFFIFAIVGLLLFVMTQKNKSLLFSSLLLLSPYLFNVISLVLGLSIAFSKHIYPYETYNLRYGSTVAASVAICIGIIASKGKWGKAIVTILILSQIFIFYTSPLDIIADAKVGNIASESKASEWIQAHPIKGNTLLSTLAHDPILFDGHIPMEKLIYEGNQHLWIGALEFPEGYADRIILKSSDTFNDAVRKRLYGKKVLEEKYTKVYDDDYQVYDKKTTSY